MNAQGQHNYSADDINIEGNNVTIAPYNDVDLAPTAGDVNIEPPLGDITIDSITGTLNLNSGGNLTLASGGFVQLPWDTQYGTMVPPFYEQTVESIQITGNFLSAPLIPDFTFIRIGWQVQLTVAGGGTGTANGTAPDILISAAGAVPSSMRPGVAKYMPCFIQNAGVFAIGQIRIISNGTLEVHNGLGTVPINFPNGGGTSGLWYTSTAYNLS